MLLMVKLTRIQGAMGTGLEDPSLHDYSSMHGTSRFAAVFMLPIPATRSDGSMLKSQEWQWPLQRPEQEEEDKR